jgi:hypothetical protein
VNGGECPHQSQSGPNFTLGAAPCASSAARMLSCANHSNTPAMSIENLLSVGLPAAKYFMKFISSVCQPDDNPQAPFAGAAGLSITAADGAEPKGARCPLRPACERRPPLHCKGRRSLWAWPQRANVWRKATNPGRGAPRPMGSPQAAKVRVKSNGKHELDGYRARG